MIVQAVGLASEEVWIFELLNQIFKIMILLQAILIVIVIHWEKENQFSQVILTITMKNLDLKNLKFLN